MNETAPRTTVAGSLACASSENDDVPEKSGKDALSVVSGATQQEKAAPVLIFHDSHESIVF
jgi:hypothetical protein